MANIVAILGDANSQVPTLLLILAYCLTPALPQVRSCAMETIVEVYRHVGVKVRTDLGKRNIPGSRMATLTARFDAIDAATNAVDEVGVEVGWYYL